MTTIATTNLPVVQRAQLALNSEAVEAEFRQLAAQSQGILSIKDRMDYDMCHNARMRLVKARTITTARGKGAREDAQAYAKSVIAEEKRLLSLIAPEEQRLTAMEETHDAIERKRVQDELDRCARISQAIQDLNMMPANLAGANSGVIAVAIEALKANDVSQWAQDQTTAAQVAHGRALQALQQLHAGAVAQEQAQAAEQARIAQERAELTRLKQEQERDRAELEKLRKAEAERERIRAEEEAKRQWAQDQPAAVQVPVSGTEVRSDSLPPVSAAAQLKPVVTLKASGKVIPSDTAIIHAVAVAFQTDDATALEWLCAMFSRQAA